MGALVIFSMMVTPALAAAPSYTEITSSSVIADKGESTYTFKATINGKIPRIADSYIKSLDNFAYGWYSLPDCSQYELSDCGGNHITAVYAILNPGAGTHGHSVKNWHVVAAVLSLHPTCQGDEELVIANEVPAKIKINEDTISVSIDAGEARVTPGNFTGAQADNLVANPSGYPDLCIGSLD